MSTITVRDAKIEGVEVQNAHFFQAVRQLFIQSPAKASFSCIGIEINGQLARPVVCGAADKGMCVCITRDSRQ